MRILFITERFPYPLHDGGALRTHHILHAIAQEHEVWLLAHQPHDTNGIIEPQIDGLRDIVTVPEPHIVRRLFGNCVNNGLRSQPLFLLKNWSAPLLHMADTLLRRHRFDAIHFNHLDTACYCLVRGWSQRKVFDTHNCLSAMALHLSKSSTSRLRRAVFAREAARLGNIEKAVCERMDMSLVCSLDDAARFKQMQENGHYVVVPNGVDTEYYRPLDPSREVPGTLVFTGAMNYYPNEEASLFLCRKILPMVRDANPLARVVLVGRDPTRKVRGLHNGKSIIVTGRVADVRPYVEQAQAFVVPLQHGGGTRLKILEAFAMGKAVVATPLGAEGIPARHDKEILLADDADSFTRQVISVLRNGDLRRRLGGAARQLAHDRFAWSCVERSVRESYCSLATCRKEK